LAEDDGDDEQRHLVDEVVGEQAPDEVDGHRVCVISLVPLRPGGRGILIGRRKTEGPFRGLPHNELRWI